MVPGCVTARREHDPVLDLGDDPVGAHVVGEDASARGLSPPLLRGLLTCVAKPQVTA